MTRVVLRKGESDDQLLKRFGRKVIKDGVLGEMRRRRYFVGKAEQRRLDKKKAVRRLKRKRGR